MENIDSLLLRELELVKIESTKSKTEEAEKLRRAMSEEEESPDLRKRDDSATVHSAQTRYQVSNS